MDCMYVCKEMYNIVESIECINVCGHSISSERGCCTQCWGEVGRRVFCVELSAAPLAKARM